MVVVILMPGHVVMVSLQEEEGGVLSAQQTSSIRFPVLALGGAMVEAETMAEQAEGTMEEVGTMEAEVGVVLLSVPISSAVVAHVAP